MVRASTRFLIIVIIIIIIINISIIIYYIYKVHLLAYAIHTGWSADYYPDLFIPIPFQLPEEFKVR